MKKVLAGVLLLFIVSFYARSQGLEPSVSGIIKSESGAVLEGVSVRAKNTGTGASVATASNSNGVFQFTALPAGMYRFYFTHIGYQEKLVEGYNYNGTGSVQLNIIMDNGTSATEEEVVVVGYGRSSKRDVTGAVKSIKSAEFNRGIINSPEELLQVPTL